MIRSSNINKKGSDYYVAQGFIPSNIKRESVSCTLEYAYDDWAISRMAGAMGRDDVAREYAQRASSPRGATIPRPRRGTTVSSCRTT